MTKFTYTQTADMQFIMAFQRLSQLPLQGRMAYQVKKWGDAITQARKKIADEFQKDILEKFAERDEAGVIKLQDPKNANSFTIPDAQMPEYQKANEAFGNKVYEFGRPKIQASFFMNLDGVRAADLSALDPIIDDTEEDTGVTGVTGPQLAALQGGRP